MKALTYRQYRLINMLILTAVFVMIESAIVLGARKWFPELAYTLSLATIFISLEMMRWGAFAAVSAVASGLTFCIAYGANKEQFLIYCIGNAVTLLALLFLKFVGYEKVRKSAALTAVYVILVFLLAQIGRWLVAMILGHSPLMLVQFLATDALSGVFAVIVIQILRNADGLFENQKSYLLRLEREHKEKQEKEQYQD